MVSCLQVWPPAYMIYFVCNVYVYISVFIFTFDSLICFAGPVVAPCFQQVCGSSTSLQFQFTPYLMLQVRSEVGRLSQTVSQLVTTVLFFCFLFSSFKWLL